ncbi:hypothetical protein [Bacillus mojavensis]
MNLIIYVNDNFEEEKALFDLESKKALLTGDYYHDKIDERIEGYLEALKDFKIVKEEELELCEVYIDKSHEHYDLLFQG